MVKKANKMNPSFTKKILFICAFTLLAPAVFCHDNCDESCKKNETLKKTVTQEECAFCKVFDPETKYTSKESKNSPKYRLAQLAKKPKNKKSQKELIEEILIAAQLICFCPMDDLCKDCLENREAMLKLKKEMLHAYQATTASEKAEADKNIRELHQICLNSAKHGHHKDFCNNLLKIYKSDTK